MNTGQLLSLDTANTQGVPSNPFVGLRPFDTHESLLYFGRREQTIELLQKLHTTRFLAVVGSSGCGKSSLIRAGLIPKLKAGFLVADRDEWRVAVMRPGEAPLANLAEAVIASIAGRAASEAERKALLAKMSEAGARAILEQLAPALADTDVNLLLLVDQFEELFRFALSSQSQRQREEAADFVATMLRLSEQQELPIYVVLTMRSDFIGECDNFYGLPEALNRSLYLVPKLTRQQRQQAIEGPLRLFGANITQRLLDRVLNDVGEQDDQLPVLQHALMRTWEHWRQSKDPALDLPHYDAIGTIHQALSLDADQAITGGQRIPAISLPSEDALVDIGVESVSPEDLRLATRVFQTLTETDDRGRRIRRPARLTELQAVTQASRAKILDLIERFRGHGRSFLNLYGDPAGDPLLDISHESLIRQWKLLGLWMNQEARWRRIYLRIADTAKRYQNKEASLLKDPDLALALKWRKGAQPTAEWARRYEAGFAFSDAMAFLDKSRHWQLARRIIFISCIALAVISLFFFQIQLQVTETTLLRQSSGNVTDAVELSAEGDTQGAIDRLNQAIEISPTNNDAYFYRGTVYLQKGDKANAEADFNKFLELGGASEKRAEAQKFLAALQEKPVAKSRAVSPDNDKQCAQLVEQMFDSDRGTRIAATTTLINNWKDYPTLVPVVLDKAETQISNKSGIINSLLVLERSWQSQPNQSETNLERVNRLIETVQQQSNGGQTQERISSLKQVIPATAPPRPLKQSGEDKDKGRPRPIRQSAKP